MHRKNNARTVVSAALVAVATFATQQTVSLAQQRPSTSQSSTKVAERPLVVAPAWNAAGPVVVDGQTFASWAAYFESDFFRMANKRCATLAPNDDGEVAGGVVGDCGFSGTNPTGAAIYAPAGTKFRIPTVFHVIRNAALTQGNLSLSQVQANIVVLNEDFLAMTGTPGAPGTNGQIEFVLTNDVGDTPGSGILYSANDAWYNDTSISAPAGYCSTAVDTNNYLNIYSNSAGGALGYVPNLGSNLGPGAPPQTDRVVLLWSAVGDPCPAGGVYCMGRTATHEVGHYLGLYHTFEACGTTTSPGCYSSGDRICDTNAEASPLFGCFNLPPVYPGVPPSTCADGVDPYQNYMDYTDDICMDRFTNEQVRRMRCVLDNRRINLPFRIPIFSGVFTGTPNTLTNGVTVAGTTVCDADDAQLGMSDGAGETGSLYAGFGLNEPGDEVAYRIVHPGGPFKVSLFGLSSDLDVFLIGAAGTPAATIAGSAFGSTNNEQIVSGALAAGTYYAVVDTFAVSSHSVYGSNFSIRYTRCLGDINNTHTIDVNDLLAVINNWGACPLPCPPRCAPDIAPPGGDCQVNVNDLLAVINNWGACPP